MRLVRDRRDADLVLAGRSLILARRQLLLLRLSVHELLLLVGLLRLVPNGLEKLEHRRKILLINRFVRVRPVAVPGLPLLLRVRATYGKWLLLSRACLVAADDLLPRAGVVSRRAPVLAVRRLRLLSSLVVARLNERFQIIVALRPLQLALHHFLVHRCISTLLHIEENKIIYVILDF